METILPAVITVVKEINVPRLPSLRGLARAKSARIPVWTAQDLGVDPNTVGRAGSATWVVKIFFPQRVRRAEMLPGSAEAQVDSLISKLKEARLI
jgi:electron transfer flavoprotein beta subunit